MKLKRTHTCGQLQRKDVGSSAILNGWVGRTRDHGDLLFIDLRDRYGITQVVFNRARNIEVHTLAKSLRPEFVVAVRGEVAPRPEGTANPGLATGEIELLANELEILNTAAPLPMEVDDHTEASTEVRLRYRHLDLRRPSMQESLIFRHKVIRTIRRTLDELQFVDVETPFLTKSTPEGARDFLVPSRLSLGEFFALPQSPQLFKQVLMCAGFDRYYQIVRCFRDEDLRADRQPEFTQLDVEMSFIEEEDILRVIEGLMVVVMREAAGIEVASPFPRITYREAIDRYGHDAPDLRFGLTLVDVTDLARQSEFKVFQSVAASGGVIRGLNAKSASDQLPRRKLDALTEFVQEMGGKGLAWMRIEGETVNSPIVKFFPAPILEQLRQRMNASAGDVLFFVAGDLKTVSLALRYLRLRLGNDLGLIPKNAYHFSWVVDFPLLEWDEEEKRYAALHHPFTSPKPEHLSLLEDKPLSVLARAYDLVLNGVEIGGGSIRIHDQEVQKRMFRLLGITDEDAEIKFGFLLECFRHGAPPHGGIALGMDRIIMLLRGFDSIRDVIAFPKTQKGTCLFTRAPSPVAPRQLRELGIQTSANLQHPKNP